LTVIGARPQIIKASAVSRAIINTYGDRIHEVLVHTGQHYDKKMSDVFFEELQLPQPAYNLAVGSDTHARQIASMLIGLDEVIQKEKPTAILIYGDTNSTLAGALSAAKLGYPVIHVEAGLRSFNRSMPEEINRVTADHLSSILFAPTKTAIDNLKTEGIIHSDVKRPSGEKPAVYHCGDVMYDNASFFSKQFSITSELLAKLGVAADTYNLLTIHRENNTTDDERLEGIFYALIELAEEGERFVFPVHPRTRKKIEHERFSSRLQKLVSQKKILLIEPVSYLEMLELEASSKMIITDSGGVQKEAYFTGRPCIILRDETEWSELVTSGHAVLADADKSRILEGFRKLSTHKFTPEGTLFGDGNAAGFICEKLIEHLS
jgi:UDP-GlcNAc3NAcA epimerase